MSAQPEEDDGLISVLICPPNLSGMGTCRECDVPVVLDAVSIEALLEDPGTLVMCTACGDDLVLFAMEHGGAE